MPLRVAFVCLVAALAAAVLADGAEAQRRGRRRPRPAPAAEAAPAPAPAADEGRAGPPEDAAGAEADASTSASLDEALGALLDELVALRARVAAIGREIAAARLRVRVRDRSGRGALARLSVALDGTPLADLRDETPGDAGRDVFEGAVGPGPHVLRVEAARAAADGGAPLAVRRDDLRFVVARDRLTVVTVELAGAAALDRDGAGTVTTETRLRVEHAPLPAPRAEGAP